MAAERTQHDSMDLMGNPIRLVYEKETDDPNEKNYTSTLFYWVEDFTQTMVFADGKTAMQVYKGLKSARSRITLEVNSTNPKVEVSEDRR